MAKPNQQSSNSPRWEAAGWGFWSVIFLIALGPSIYLAIQISYEETSVLINIVVGFSIAAFTAGVVTFIVNTILQARAERLRKTARSSKENSR